MGSTPAQEVVLSAYAQKVIRFKARQLSHRPGFSPSDEEDIRQELLVHLFKQAGGFDSERGSLNTYIDRIVCSAAMVLFRNRRRKCRAGNETNLSLDAMFVEKEGKSYPFIQDISSEDVHRRTGFVPRPTHFHKENRDAFDAMLEKLTPSEQAICERLRTDSLSAVARDMNVPRRQIRKVLSNIRKHLEKPGFELF